MQSSGRMQPFAKMLGVVLLLVVLTLAGCGGGGSGNTSGKPGTGIRVVVGSKLDPDGLLLGEMYTLLLQNQGFTVVPRLSLGQTPVLDKAIKSGQIDIYPEFTGTALSLLKLASTQNAQMAYSEVNSAYQQQFQITWLDPAYGLNDSYAICTSQAVAQKYHLTSLSDLAPVASQLSLATPQDGIQAAEMPVENGYNIHFKNVVQITEPLGFGAVSSGNADLNVCYTTDPAIVVNNFVVLKDPNNVFPIYNPAPIVRNSVLQKSSAIATTLNALEPKLTTSIMVGLIKQYAVDHKPYQEVAKTFLQSQGLLPA